MEKESTDNRSKIVWAVILIAVGVLWFFSLLNSHFHLWELFQPLFFVFSRIGKVIFSLPMVLILAGLVLLAGKRRGGWILIIVGGIFLIPKIFMIPDFPASVIFPLMMIVAGGALIIKRF